MNLYGSVYVEPIEISLFPLKAGRLPLTPHLGAFCAVYAPLNQLMSFPQQDKNIVIRSISCGVMSTRDILSLLSIVHVGRITVNLQILDEVLKVVQGGLCLALFKRESGF
jgi:hypothetical protein